MKTSRLVLALLILVFATRLDAQWKTLAADAAYKTEGGKLAVADAPKGAWNLWSSGMVGDFIQVAKEGKYKVIVRASGTPAAGEGPEMAVSIDHSPAGAVTVQAGKFRDYSFDVQLGPGVHLLAVDFTNDMAVPVKPGSTVWKEDRNLYLAEIRVQSPAGAPDVVRGDAGVWRKELARRETKTLEMADRQIETIRKADVTVRVVDAAGKPVPGAKVTVRLKRHEFLFGCNIYMFDRFENPKENDLYKERFADLFNYATVAFYWRSYEWNRGKPIYEYTDKVVDWCRKHDIRMKGHPLLWANDAGIPVWSKGVPPADLQKQRVKDILGRYGDRIAAWEIVNEAAHLPQIPIDQPYRWARQDQPKAYLIVNEFGVLATGYPAFFEMLRKAQAAGVPFDGIGIQAHEPRTTRFPMDGIWTVLDRYAMLGKDLHITEFTPPSGGQKQSGETGEGVWDEAAQADYAVKFYRTCFAHPSVVAITWWDLCDRGSWLEGGGMLHKDLSPKPVYKALHTLIREKWNTDVTGQTDKDGTFKLRGFLGEYDVSVGGRAAPGEYRLTKSQPGKRQEWTLKIVSSAK